MRKYRDGSAAARAFSMAFTHVHITLQHLGLSDDHAMLFDRLASRVFGADASCISPDDLARNTLGQANLWGYGISGDLPIVLVRVTEADAIPLVRQLLHAQEYWRVKGLRADVVILNEHPAEYLDEVQSAAHRARAGAALGRLERTSRAACSCCAPTACPTPTAICCRPSRASSCAAISASWRRSSIARRRGCIRRDDRAAARSAAAAASRPRRRWRRRRSCMENGVGGFTPDGREYVDRARRRSRDAAAVVERAGEPGVRHRWSARRARRSPGRATAARTG